MKNLICRIFGHSREYTHRQYMGRRGWRHRSYARCLRCGLGEPECHEQPMFERAWRGIRSWWWDLKAKCEAMDKPGTADDDIPF